MNTMTKTRKAWFFSSLRTTHAALMSAIKTMKQLISSLARVQRFKLYLIVAATVVRHSAITAALLVTLVTLARTNTSRATVITQTLGHMAFPDGTKVAIVPFAAAHVGDPFPFDGTFNGSDPSGPNFSESWMFSYGALTNITAATLALGILDSDSAAPGNQVASFILNGNIDLSSPLNVAFEANPSPNSYVNDYTITLDGSTFSELATGTATFALTLQGPGLGVLGTTPSNGAALDFSTITITTQTIPEPTSLVLAALGFAGWAAWGWRCRFGRVEPA
jgi:PEP-CTERM motif-containing protein